MSKIILMIILIMISILFMACDEGREQFYSSWGKGYVSNYNQISGRRITVIDGRKLKQGKYPIVKEIGIVSATPSGPFLLAVNPKTWRVYVGNYNNNTVTVINASTDEIAKTIMGFDTPYGIGVNKNINKIYVSSFLRNQVDIIDGESDVRVSTTIALPPNSVGGCIAVNPDDNKVYVSHPTPATGGVIGGFTVIDLIDNKNNIYATYSNTDASQFNDSTGIAINKRTNKIYLANRASNRVSVIDGFSNQVLKHIDGLINPLRVAVNEKTNKIYVTNNNSIANSVTVINGVNDTIESTITGFNLPRDIAVNEETNIILVVSNGGNFITAIDGDTHEKIVTTGGFIDPAGVVFID